MSEQVIFFDRVHIIITNRGATNLGFRPLTDSAGCGIIRIMKSISVDILRGGGKHNSFPARSKTTLKFVIQSPMSKVQLSQLGLWTLDFGRWHGLEEQ